MKEVTMKIQSKIIIAAVENNYNAVSIYTLTDANEIINEQHQAVENQDVKSLLSYGVICEDNMSNTNIRPSTICSSINSFKSKLITAIQNNNCCQGGSMTIEINLGTITMPLNNKQDCINALVKLKEVLPVYAPIPAYHNDDSWTHYAYTLLRKNTLPFLAGAATAGVALTLRNRA